MADRHDPPVDPAGPDPATPSTVPHPHVTRRDFLIRSNAGAVAAGIVTGVGFASTLEQGSGARPATPKPPPAAAAVTARRVTLDIDGRKHDVMVDVRESLWETLTHQLGLSVANLGCDRAECGACTVLVDGRPVLSCSLLTARLGRGQKILTVAGITRGPGVDGLHPVQRALWLEGGFQCGICTRGVVMSGYALLQKTRTPSDDDIREALSGNICRCGEYTGIVGAMRKAAAEMRGERVTYASRLPSAAAAVVAAAATSRASKQFEFVAPLGTIEQFDEIALVLKLKPGILDVAGTERTITPTWDPATLDETRVRQFLAEIGHAVK